MMREDQLKLISLHQFLNSPQQSGRKWVTYDKQGTIEALAVLHKLSGQEIKEESE